MKTATQKMGAIMPPTKVKAPVELAKITKEMKVCAAIKTVLPIMLLTITDT